MFAGRHDMKFRFTECRAIIAVLALFAAACSSFEDTPITNAIANPEIDDPYLWLESIDSDQVIQWASNKTEVTRNRLRQDEDFSALTKRFLSELEDPSKLPDSLGQLQVNGYVYQVFQTAQNPRGILRRRHIEDFENQNARWTDLIDIDELAEQDGKSWYLTANNLRISPSGNRMLIPLSEGGADAEALREFDLERNEFVSDGFRTGIKRQFVHWLDDETIVIAIALSEDEESSAGYARHLRVWSRSQSLTDAKIIVSIEPDSIMVFPTLFQSEKRREVFAVSARTFSDLSYNHINKFGESDHLNLPRSNLVSLFNGFSGIENQMLIKLEEAFSFEGETYPAGSFVAIDFDAALSPNGLTDLDVSTVYTPRSNETISIIGGYTVSGRQVYINALRDVSATLLRVNLSDSGTWERNEIKLPSSNGELSLPLRPDPLSDVFLARFETVLHAPIEMTVRNGILTTVNRQNTLDGLERFQAERLFARANDGTNIPYLLVASKDLKFDGSHPVLIYAYGGFGLPMPPKYDFPYLGAVSRAWLEQNGVLVIANPRGGGEYGPDWHAAAMKLNRQTVYDDIYAIADELVAQKLTVPGGIGIFGGSNGGLTAGVAATQRPDLFGAAVAVAPLMDMRRFHKLFAGANWLAEYGSPEDPAEWRAIRSYSPLHNIEPYADYPEMLLMTSTTDDRVHPAHARKMAARMEDMGHPVWFFEAPEGGHAMAIDNLGRAEVAAMQFVYLREALILERRKDSIRKSNK